ncbi:Lactonase, 7-bladed beta-propeller-domain-containing protein [Chlamydoabsidia padenii]|nr:Lactonase, 7-bladed beta-propeller-domain-containing protein [Chlamydoabsidia padenii]
MPNLPVYVSGYTQRSGKGIYSYLFDTDAGLFSKGQLVAACDSPSYITLHRPSDQIFATNETNQYEGEQGTGYVTAFRRNEDDSGLKLLNTQSSHGSDPCYLTVRGQHCLVSNYSGGSIALFPITPEGFSPASSVLRLGPDLHSQPTRANPQRQEAPHAHAIDLDPITHRLAIVMDLGSDLAVLTHFDPPSNQLKPHGHFRFPDGTGPRHIVFAPNMRSFAYVLGELSNQIFMLELNNGTFNMVQQISALPPGVASTQDMLGAEIDITPNGRFLYATVRGHDSISVFFIDDRTGKLVFVENQSTLGEHPRYFVIDPYGNYLIVANQMSDNIVTFKIDQETGKLTHVQTIEHPEATCIKFWF